MGLVVLVLCEYFNSCQDFDPCGFSQQGADFDLRATFGPAVTDPKEFGPQGNKTVSD